MVGTSRTIIPSARRGVPTTPSRGSTNRHGGAESKLKKRQARRPKKPETGHGQGNLGGRKKT